MCRQGKLQWSNGIKTCVFLVCLCRYVSSDWRSFFLPLQNNLYRISIPMRKHGRFQMDFRYAWSCAACTWSFMHGWVKMVLIHIFLIYYCLIMPYLHWSVDLLHCPLVMPYLLITVQSMESILVSFILTYRYDRFTRVWNLPNIRWVQQARAISVTVWQFWWLYPFINIFLDTCTSYISRSLEVLDFNFYTYL